MRNRGGARSRNILHNLAVCDKPGTISFHFVEGSEAEGGLDTPVRLRNKKASNLAVKCDTLGSILRVSGVTHIDLFSLDVEGFELQVHICLILCVMILCHTHNHTHTNARAHTHTHTHTHGQVLESMDWSISFNVLVMEQTKCHAQIEALLTTKGYEYIREQRGNVIWAHRNFTPRATAAAPGGSVKAQDVAASLSASGSAEQESGGPRPQIRSEKLGGVSMAAVVACVAVVGGGAVLVCFKRKILQKGCWTGHRRLGVGQVISSTHRQLTKLYTLSRRVLTCMCTSAVGQVVCTHLRGQHIHAGRSIFRV